MVLAKGSCVYVLNCLLSFMLLESSCMKPLLCVCYLLFQVSQFISVGCPLSPISRC